MSIGHESIMDLFEPARALEPRDSEIRDALALAMSEPPRSPALASVANLASILGAVTALAIAFAVVGVRGFAAPTSKKHQRHVEVVGAVRSESTAIDIAALARMVQARQTRMRRGSPGARPRQPMMAAGTHLVRTAAGAGGFSASPGSVRAREQRPGPSRRARCECARRSLGPPRIALAQSRSRSRG